MRAQRVDLDSSPSPQSSPTTKNDKVQIILSNAGGFVAIMCADNVVETKNCTDDAWFLKDSKTVDVTLKPGETQLKLHGYVRGDRGGGHTGAVNPPPAGESLCVTYYGVLTGHHFDTASCTPND